MPVPVDAYATGICTLFRFVFGEMIITSLLKIWRRATALKRQVIEGAQNNNKVSAQTHIF